jgi:hypothetical protein
MDRTRREFLQAVVMVGGAGLVGCGGGGGTDAGSPGSDAGPPESDAGPGGTDAGPPESDAGPGGTDAGPTDIDAGPAGCTAPGVTIGTNHGHVLVVPPADVTAGVDRTYDIQGSSRHAHSVTISAANFATLAGGGTVMVTSTNGAAHTHAVTVVCG